ncbi:uncharacterized protein LOC135462530 [Liolophura sinensis]|uniref:uncharacterized protein LOC135462530 n=1 Tax=Liolophura sinensis TaxID=3198878 RepID=UPI0031586732
MTITASVLRQMHSALRKAIFSQYTDMLMITVTSIAFLVFLRCGEFTDHGSHFTLKFNLCLEDSGHSFRSGTASVAGQAGVQDHKIKI